MVELISNSNPQILPSLISDSKLTIDSLSHTCTELRCFSHNTDNPDTVLTDFETALQGALIFPDASVCGCWFHFSQAVFKHTVQFGLEEYFVKQGGKPT